jgi:hypothetical protein
VKTLSPQVENKKILKILYPKLYPKSLTDLIHVRIIFFTCPKGRYYIGNYFGFSDKLIHFIQKQELQHGATTKKEN